MSSEVTTRQCDVSRRNILSAAFGASVCGAEIALALSASSLARSQGLVSRELGWGGLGFSVAAAQLRSSFPVTLDSLEKIGGLKTVVAELVGALQSAYLGGKGQVKDIFKALDTGESLIFCVAFDFEQLIATPGVGEGAFDDVESFLYAQAQVVYIDPGSGSGGGDFRILYSFPFRVQYNFRARPGDNDDRALKFSKTFVENERSLSSVFRTNVASKSFREKSFPSAIRVTNVSFTPEFLSSLDFLKIRDRFPAEFVANSFSTTLAEIGGLSVIPFRGNQLMGETIASRFKQESAVFKLASTMGGKENLDFAIDIEMFRMVRKISGENQASVRIARGMSCFLNLLDVRGDSSLAKVKLSFISDNVIDRLSFTKSLAAFDLRYMVQIVLAMFEDFVALVIRRDVSKMERLGLKSGDSTKDIEEFRRVFSRCVYSDKS